MDVIELNGQKYITLKDNSNIRIVILQRGWVFVGMYVNNSDDEHMLINGFNYRYQGSKKGFGYVANYGPSEKCILDPCPTPIRFNPITIIATIDCNGEAWEKCLEK